MSVVGSIDMVDIPARAEEFRRLFVRIDGQRGSRIPTPALEQLAFISDPDDTILADFELDLDTDKSGREQYRGWVAAISRTGLDARVTFLHASDRDALKTDAGDYTVSVRKLRGRVVGVSIDQDAVAFRDGRLSERALHIHLPDTTVHLRVQSHAVSDGHALLEKLMTAFEI